MLLTVRRTMKTWNWHKHASAAVKCKTSAKLARAKLQSAYAINLQESMAFVEDDVRYGASDTPLRRSNRPLYRVLAASRWLILLALYESRARPLERHSLLASYPKVAPTKDILFIGHIS